MKLKKGDTIECNDADDMIEIHRNLSLIGIECEFCYEKDGERGYWLEITKDEE